jgi:hypothetical protein
MRDDRRGIGGFIEDIPVLLFVLAGVTTLIGASVWAAGFRSEIVKADELDGVAEESLGRVLCALSDGANGYISVDRMGDLNLSWMRLRVSDGVGWLVSVKVIHPWVEQLVLAEGDGSCRASCSGCGRALLNAPYGTDGSAIVEVTALVWTS